MNVGIGLATCPPSGSTIMVPFLQAMRTHRSSKSRTSK
jgi:hypothetical protein